MDYFLHLLILIAFYTILAQSLNLTAGLTGLVSLSQAGFYGVAAYTAAVMSVRHGAPLLVVLPLAMFICGCIALLVSLISLRTVEDYFIICTLGIQVIIHSVMNNWTELTNGPNGIAGIPPARVGGLTLEAKPELLALAAAFMVLVWLFLSKLSRSGFGNTLRAISEDEIFTQSLGKNVYLHKTTAFTISAVLAAIPGVLYAYYIAYVSPDSFTTDESILILSIVIIGGLGSLTGSFFASAFMVLLPEVLREIGLPQKAAANLRQIIFGLIVILVTMLRKEGLFDVLGKAVPRRRQPR